MEKFLWCLFATAYPIPLLILTHLSFKKRKKKFLERHNRYVMPGVGEFYVPKELDGTITREDWKVKPVAKGE